MSSAIVPSAVTVVPPVQASVVNASSGAALPELIPVDKSTAATPYFIYFMVLLLIALAVLIALFCIALADPEFPSKKHLGPTLVGAPLPHTVTLVRPETGAPAAPYEIPYELHRVKPEPPVSRLRRVADTPVVEPVAAPPVKLDPVEPVAPANAISKPSMMLQTSGALARLLPSTLMTLAPKAVDAASPSAASAAPSISRVDWPEESSSGGSSSDRNSVCTIHGNNFDEQAKITFITAEQRVPGDCSVLSRAEIRCRTAGLQPQPQAAVLVTNLDSQAVLSQAQPYLSFPGGLAKTWPLDKPCPIVVGLFQSGGAIAPASTTIWIEILARDAATDGASSRSSWSSLSSLRDAVVYERWIPLESTGQVELQYMFSQAGSFVVRATAVQQRGAIRHIVAPIVESWPVLVKAETAG